ncbi:MAG TPA: hypothetical protein VJB11_02895 [archaeon]|nr:hypothetical protein [archaeon]
MSLLNPIEAKILKKVAENQLITKSEIQKYLQNNGSSRDLSSVIDSATDNLMKKQFIAIVRPLGSTCYAITQKGTKMLDEL